MSHHCHTLHGLRGGGATDHWLQYRDLPQLRRRGRWTSGRTLERYIYIYIQEGTFLFHQNQLSKEVADRLSALAELAPRFFAEQDYEESRHQPVQPPLCNGKGRGVHSALRSGVEQRSIAYTVSPLGALSLPLSDVGQKQSTSRRRTRYEHRHTEMDYVVSRVRRSRFGPANHVLQKARRDRCSSPSSPKAHSTWRSSPLLKKNVLTILNT